MTRFFYTQQKNNVGWLASRCGRLHMPEQSSVTVILAAWLPPKMAVWEFFFSNDFLGGGFKYFTFTPKFGEDEPILTHIFQMGGSTTNGDVFWSSLGMMWVPIVPRTWGRSQPGCRSLTWSKFGERCLWKSYMINQKTLDFRWFFSIFCGKRLEVCLGGTIDDLGPIRAAMMNLRLSPCSHVSSEPHGTPPRSRVPKSSSPWHVLELIDRRWWTHRTLDVSWMLGDWDVQGTKELPFCSNWLLNYPSFAIPLTITCALWGT